MKLHLKLTSAMLSALMCASMVMAPVSVIADDSAAPSETQTAETTEKEEPKETKAAPKETEKPAPKETEKQETETPEKTEPAETEKQEPEVTEKDPETTEEQKPSETEKQEPAETEKTEPETTETQEPGQTEETMPEETVPEVKPEKGPVTTARRKAKNEVSITKTKDNTCLGTSKIAKPVEPSNSNTAWSGSYVYFGKYNNIPIKFRVLAPSTNAYGGTTMFLDSDEVLFDKQFDKEDRYWGNEWCGLRKYLNETFFGDSFNFFERNSIATSKGYGGIKTEDSFVNYHFTTSNHSSNSVSDKIFLLDAAELLNKPYGYSDVSGCNDNGNDWEFYNVINRKKSGGHEYWIRTKAVASGEMGIVSNNGNISYPVAVSRERGVAPALNVNLDSVVFSTVTSGKMGQAGAEYKLTVKIPELYIAVPSGKTATASGTTITIPYQLSGVYAAEANRVSVLIRRRTNWNILYYDALKVSSVSSGVGTFTLPSSLSLDDWGASSDTGYDVFILAEQTFGSQTTDYASEMVLVDKPIEKNLTVQPYIIYYNKAGAEWMDDEGISGTVSFNMTKVGPGDIVTVTATPKSGYVLSKIEWQNGLVSTMYDITTKASFTVGDKDPYVYVYFLKLEPDEAPKYKVHCYVMNENLSIDDAGTYGSVTFDKYEAESGETITVSATPNSGYELYELGWTDGAKGSYVNITSTKSFVVGNADPYVYAVFVRERNPNSLTVKAKTAKVKYKKLRKKKQTVARSKVMNVSNAQGTVTYKLVTVKRGKSKKYKKYFKINATTGNVTIKKKLKKGTYKVTCSVTAAGNGSYKPGTKTVTFKIKVK